MELEGDESERNYGTPYQLDDQWRPGDRWMAGDESVPPKGWMTAEEVIAWVVWRTWVPSYAWDTAFYPGAAEWLHPADVLSRLTEVADGNFTPPMTDWPDWLARAVSCQDAVIHAMGSVEFLEDPSSFRVRPDLWPKAAQYLIDWINGEWEHDYGILGALARDYEKGAPAPDSDLAEWAASIGSHAGYRRCVRNYVNFWKGSEALRRAIAQGRIAAYGVPAYAASPPGRQEIPVSVFAAPVAICAPGVLPCTTEEAQASASRPTPTWYSLRFDAEAVVAQWPDYVPPSEPVTSEPQSTIPASCAPAPPSQRDAPRPKFTVSAGRAWYLLRHRTWPPETPPPSEAADLAAARAHFAAQNPAIPRETIRKIRRELAPLEWRKSGRRKPS